ncbi:dihydrofolate reductase family protein [Nocardia brasiliensis]|uniref:dihydrofolate reductase family protein n=1 Tax=Nocardia brasiliensis TaxID=37326 RepID=UPI00130EE033
MFAGVRTAQEFLRLDAVDELRLLVFPVSLGAGRRLFGGVLARRLHSIDAEPFPKSGVLPQARPPPDRRPASNRLAMPQVLGGGDLRRCRPSSHRFAMPRAVGVSSPRRRRPRRRADWPGCGRSAGRSLSPGMRIVPGG